MNKSFTLALAISLLLPAHSIACVSKIVSMTGRDGKTLGGLDDFSIDRDNLTLRAGEVTYKIYPEYLDDQVKGDPNNNTDNDERAAKTKTCVQVSGACDTVVKVCVEKGGNYDKINQDKLHRDAGTCPYLKDIFKIKEYAGSARIHLNIQDKSGKNFGTLDLQTKPMVMTEQDDINTRVLIETHLDCRNYLTEDGKSTGPKGPNDLQYPMCSDYISKKDVREKTIKAWSTENNLGQFEVNFKPANGNGDVINLSSSTSYFEKVVGANNKSELFPVECVSKVKKSEKVCGTDVLARHHWDLMSYNERDVKHKSEGIYDQTTVQHSSQNSISFDEDTFSPVSRGVGGSNHGMNIFASHEPTEINGCEAKGGSPISAGPQTDRSGPAPGASKR